MGNDSQGTYLVFPYTFWKPYAVHSIHSVDYSEIELAKRNLVQTVFGLKVAEGWP